MVLYISRKLKAKEDFIWSSKELIIGGKDSEIQRKNYCRLKAASLQTQKSASKNAKSEAQKNQVCGMEIKFNIHLAILKREQ